MIYIFGAVVMLFFIRVLYSAGEIWFERDWPRATWRGLLIAALLLFLCFPAFGQVSRFDVPQWTINTSTPQPGGLYPMLAFPNARVQICATWTNGVAACNTLATTYTDSTGTTPCSTATQLVSANSGTCSANSDSAGGIGGFIAPGSYALVITTSYGTYGPYQFGVDAAGAYCPLSGCTFTGPVAAGTTLPSDITSGLWGITSQGRLNMAAYLNAPADANCPNVTVGSNSYSDAPCLALEAAAASGGLLAVDVPYLPSKGGVYYTNGLKVPFSYLTMKCSSGASFTLASTAVWGLQNPNADLTSGSNGVNNLLIDGCTWDTSNAPAALGGWRIKGIGFSNFTNNRIYTNNDTYPAVTGDGANYTHNGGDYDNNFRGNVLYNKASGTGALPWKGTGVLLQNVSNEWHWDNGSMSRFATELQITSGNHNEFKNIDAENWGINCVNVANSSAAYNTIEDFRCETDLSLWAASHAYAQDAQIIDSNGNLEQATTPGTSGTPTHPAWPAGTVDSIVTAYGCNVVGAVGQTVLLTSFNNGSTATATGTLTAANTIANASWAITSAGTGATASPTSATCSAGTVSSASGTATLVTSVGTVGSTTTDGTVTWTLETVSPSDIIATGGQNNTLSVYASGYETRLQDTTGQNSYPKGINTVPPWTGLNAQTAFIFSSSSPNNGIGSGTTPVSGEGFATLGDLRAQGYLKIGKPGDARIECYNSTNTLAICFQTDSTGNLYLIPPRGGQIDFMGTTGVYPNADNVIPFGAAANRWKGIFTSNGVSDGTNTWQLPATGTNGTLATTGQLSSIRAGTWTITASTSVAVTFSTPMSVAPTSCSMTPSASAATTGTPFATSLATTGFTVNVPTSGTLSGTYQCVVNNTN